LRSGSERGQQATKSPQQITASASGDRRRFRDLLWRQLDAIDSELENGRRGTGDRQSDRIVMRSELDRTGVHGVVGHHADVRSRVNLSSGWEYRR
jgi:hypothetical protein